MLSSYNRFLGAIIPPRMEPTERPTTKLGLPAGGVNSNVWLSSLQHWFNSTPHCLTQQYPWALQGDQLFNLPFKVIKQVQVNRFLRDLRYCHQCCMQQLKIFGNML
jgi:hypothetical protein